MTDRASDAVTVIRVATASAYDVVVGTDLLGRLPAMVGRNATRVAVVAPEGLAAAGSVRDALAPSYDVMELPVPDGEQAKTAAVAATCWEALGRAGFTRSDAVVTV